MAILTSPSDLWDAAQPSALFSSPVTITEQTGDARSIVLTGRARPYRPLPLVTEQAMELTEYPGSPVQSAQIFGARERETTISGKWKSKFLANLTASGSIDYSKPIASVDGIAVATAQDLEKLFNDVTRKGQLLQFTWGPVVRLGFIKKFEREWDNAADLKWELTFAWISQGDPNVGIGFGQQLAQAQTKSGLDGLLGQVRDGLNTLQGNLASAADMADQLLSKIDQVDSLVQQVGDVIDQTINLADTPDLAAQRAASIYGSLVDGLQDLEDTLRSTPTTALLADSVSSSSSYEISQAASTQAVASTATGAGATPTGGGVTQSGMTAKAVPVSRAQKLAAPAVLSVGTLLQAAAVRRTILRAARDMRYAAARARVAVLSQAQAPQLIAQFKAKSAIDLRLVAALYYGTPNPWQQLGFFNGIKGTSTVPTGTLLSIPRTLPSLPGSRSVLSTTASSAPSIG